MASGNLGVEEKREYFVACLWEHLKVAKRVPAKVTFNIDIMTERDAREWSELFQQSFVLTPFALTSFDHLTKTRVWRVCYTAAHQLESILPLGFHRCDAGTHTCCLYFQSGLANHQDTPLCITLNHVSILSYQQKPNTVNQVLPETIHRRERYYLSVSFCPRTVPIDSSKGKYEIAELFSAT